MFPAEIFFFFFFFVVFFFFFGAFGSIYSKIQTSKSGLVAANFVNKTSIEGGELQL
jgi:hypothetical protein